MPYKYETLKDVDRMIEEKLLRKTAPEKQQESPLVEKLRKIASEKNVLRRPF